MKAAIKKKIINFLVRKKRSREAGNLTKRFTPTEKIFLGNRLYIHDIASYHLGCAELFESQTYKFRAHGNSPLIIDCGANIGMSIIYFKELYPNASITAFEADGYIFGFLEKNMASFQYKNVELVNKAVWDCEETLSFLDEGGAGGRIEPEKKTGKYKRVETIRLREFLVGRKVDFLKVDIEGAEYKVIKDCEHELKNVDNLFIEYHSFPNSQQNLHEILEIVQNAGFRYHIKEAYTTIEPFLTRKLNVGMDLQLNIFCYKVGPVSNRKVE